MKWRLVGDSVIQGDFDLFRRFEGSALFWSRLWRKLGFREVPVSTKKAFWQLFFFFPVSKIQFLWDWPQGGNCCPFSLPATHLTLIHQTNGSFGKTVRLYCLMFSLPFKTHNYTQWAPLGNGALKLNKNSQLIKSNVPKVALLFCEPHTQVKPDEMYSTRCLYLPLNALQPWKEGVDGREETGWGTCMPFHTGRQMVQCWCNSVLRR